MTRLTTGSSSSDIKYDNSHNIDSFGRLRVSPPATLFESQLTYNLQPLLFEQITAGAGATITYDSTNRDALMRFSNTATGGKAIMQSYKRSYYQPGKSQFVFITFNFGEGVANCLKFAGYSDGTNGIELQLNGSVKQFTLYSATGNGDQTVIQDNWNIDKLDGTGLSGIVLDLTKVQVLCFDVQALYTGRVRVGFDIGGQIIYVHEFLHANLITYPYIQSATLPVRCGMTCTGTVSTTMQFICSTVISEGGVDNVIGKSFAAEGTVTAGDGVRTHILSIRPKTTFNGLTNRTEVTLEEVNVLVTGNNPVYWEICLGQAITGNTTFLDVNSTYSAFSYNTLGAISGSPAIVIASGYTPATNQSKGVINHKFLNNYPITLDAAGAIRAMGTLTLLVTGIGGASATRASFNWMEIR